MEANHSRSWLARIVAALEPCDGAILILVVGEPHREASAHLEFADGEGLAIDMHVIDVDL
jgi:hypothetical protein